MECAALMTAAVRRCVVLVLLVALPVHAVAMFAALGEAVSPDHVSRPTHHAAEVRAAHVRNEVLRIAEHLDSASARLLPAPFNSVVLSFLERRVTPRPVFSYPPYWSSTHLTI
jgi:hypothetical protein